MKGINNFLRDETDSKLSFVRLIGRHDAVFLFVIYTLFTFMFNLVDLISTNYIFAVNFWYLIYALYVFGRLMDNKKINKLKYLSFASVLLYAAIYLYTIRYHSQPFPERTYPLYNPIPLNQTLGNETFPLNSTEIGNDTLAANFAESGNNTESLPTGNDL